MTTINLYQDQQEVQRKISARSGNGGFFFSIGILVVTLLALVGLKAAVSALGQKSAALTKSIDEENSSLAGLNELHSVIDVQTRLQQIETSLQMKNGSIGRTQMTDILDNLAKDMGPGVAISSYKFEDGKIKLSFKAANYSDVSRQILNFKNSKNFSGISLTSIIREDKGVKCDLEMVI